MMTKSLEDYLEAIYINSREVGLARAVDVSKMLGVKMPSVNHALKELAARGYVDYEKYRAIRLTEKGVEAAQEIFGRHTLLKSFLISIGVSDEVAESDACAMEHILSAETMERMKEALAGGSARK